MLFQAGSVDTPFDPREFELMGYPSQIALKPTFRTFTAINSLWGPLVAGGRDGGMVSVGRSSDPVMVRAGTTIQATIVFETLEGGSRGIEDLELLYRGMRLKVAPGTQSVAAQ